MTEQEKEIALRVAKEIEAESEANDGFLLYEDFCVEFASLFLAAIRASQEPDGWQPIETAPKEKSE